MVRRPTRWREPTPADPLAPTRRAGQALVAGEAAWDELRREYYRRERSRPGAGEELLAVVVAALRKIISDFGSETGGGRR